MWGLDPALGGDVDWWEMGFPTGIPAISWNSCN